MKNNPNLGSQLVQDEYWMRQAIRLSKKGYPSPNPHVGCVIVSDGVLVGKGYHDHAGGNHAEREAILEAGKQANGATAYITLEPCNHYGKTPPCSLMLIESGIRRVVYSQPDPNPAAAGGATFLLSKGIDVVGGVLKEEAYEANEVWLKAVQRERPYVCIKVACGIDGRIALPNGESKWITSEKSRRIGHKLRADMGAVLIGRKTAEFDHPMLHANVKGVTNQPIRIVLDPHGKLGPDGNLQNPTSRDVIVTNVTVSHGLKILDPNLPMLENIPVLLNELYRQGIRSILVEGGAITISAFLQANLVDRIEIFVAGKILLNGPAWVSGQLNSLADASQWKFLKSQKVGPDMHLTLVLTETES